jgi:hypothetical protein
VGLTLCFGRPHGTDYWVVTSEHLARVSCTVWVKSLYDNFDTPCLPQHLLLYIVALKTRISFRRPDFFVLVGTSSIPPSLVS